MKKPRYYFDKFNNFIIEEYNFAPAFANFLPGVAGVDGIPLWAFFVNRAQGIASFGFKDKDHPILEFLPANKSFALVFDYGYRTFLKIKGISYEPFRVNLNPAVSQIFKINSSYIEIEERNKDLGLIFNVRYFVLPQEPLAGLVRVLSLRNTSGQPLNIELLDGLSVIVPFGTKNVFLKDLSRTVEAWMQSFKRKEYSLFRLKVAPEDIASTHYIQGGNFYTAFYYQRNSVVYPEVIVDPKCIFGEDVDFDFPYIFSKDKTRLCTQVTHGKTPCAMNWIKVKLEPEKEFSLFSVAGASDYEKDIPVFVRKLKDKEFIERKFFQSRQIINRIKNNMFICSGDKDFDQYVQNTYLDNILRGGLPLSVNGKVYYSFSRKHGDLERDYNRFKLLPVFYSQGEGNYRDINQNRRNDIYFNTACGLFNIKLFFNLLDPSGFNPLVVKPDKFYLPQDRAKSLPVKIRKVLAELLDRVFSLEEVWDVLRSNGISPAGVLKVFEYIISHSEQVESADFGEGFWIDHWIYNIDLLEEYLAVFPDRLKELFLEEDFYFYDSLCMVNPRAKRYFLEKGGKVRQGNFLHFDKKKAELISSRPNFKYRARDNYGKGKIVKVSLVTKILSVLVNKASSWDVFGLGLEMEAGKPGWCDALNGLPALLGSSFNEALELKRLAALLKRVLANERLSGVKDISMPEEIADFVQDLAVLLKRYKGSRYKQTFSYWDKSNNLKERYRQNIFFGFSGKRKTLSVSDINGFIDEIISKVSLGLKRVKNSDLVPAYFIQEVVKHKTGPQGEIIPLKFSIRALPLFLEGFVHLFRVEDKDDILASFKAVKKSLLFDRKLKMYKINAPLAGESLEIGRIRVFTPGWLENESVWLHMEYKYLLEILKSGLYKEFFEETNNCFIYKLKPENYGRSIFENSSFLASSAYPDKNIWGRGFVARLSGSTAEFVNMAIIMCCGREPFFVDKGKLCLRFSPILKSEMFTRKPEVGQIFLGSKTEEVKVPANSFCFKFLGKTLVFYHNPQRKDTFAPGMAVRKIRITYPGGKSYIFDTSYIPYPHSLNIRSGQVLQIDVYLGKDT